MMKKLFAALAALSLLFSCALAEGTLTPVETLGVNASVTYPMLEGTENDEAINALLLETGLIQDRLNVLNGMTEDGKGIFVAYTAAISGSMLSVVYDAQGQLDMFSAGQSYQAACINLETGERITLADFFTDADAAVTFMEEKLAENQGGQVSGYLEASDFAPLPVDSFYADRDGITFYYGKRQVSLLSGWCGSYRFFWYELADYLNTQEGSVLASFLPEDTIGTREELSAQCETGSLPGFALTLGQDANDAVAAFRELCDPDYTPVSRYFYLEDGWTDGLTMVTSRDSDTVTGLLMRRGQVCGLKIGVTTREEAVTALGEADASVLLDEATAADYQLQSGRCDQYHFDTSMLSLYYDDSGLLYAALLESMK